MMNDIRNTYNLTENDLVFAHWYKSLTGDEKDNLLLYRTHGDEIGDNLYIYEILDVYNQLGVDTDKIITEINIYEVNEDLKHSLLNQREQALKANDHRTDMRLTQISNQYELATATNDKLYVKYDMGNEHPFDISVIYGDKDFAEAIEREQTQLEM